MVAASFFKKIGSFLPELISVYPTYKFHLARGKVSEHDRKIIRQIEGQLKLLVNTNEKYKIHSFCCNDTVNCGFA